MRCRYILIGILLAFLCFNVPCYGDDAQAAPKSPWTIEDVIHQESVSSLTLSPDGTKALWVKTVPFKKKDRKISHIFLSTLGDKVETIQLTRGENSERSPKWSPTGNKIAFLTTRKNPENPTDISGSQLWLMDARGGEPWSVTKLQFGVNGYEWVDDNTVLFTARENRTLKEQDKKKRKDTSYVVEDQEHMTPVRLFSVDIKTKKVKQLTDNTDQITRFALSHNKKWVLTRNNQSVRYGVDKKIKPKYFLMDLDKLAPEELFLDPAFKPTSFTWDYQNRGFYFSVLKTTDYIHDGPGAQFLYYYNLKTKKHREISLDWEWGLFRFGFIPRADGFVASLANGAKPKWRRYFRKGDSFTYKELEGDYYPNIYGLVLQEKGEAALYAFSNASTPAQWFYGRLKGHKLEGKNQVTRINSHLKNKPKARTEVMRWTGAEDEEIEGILYYPHDYKKGTPYPLVLMIHGGPTGVDMDNFRESWTAYPNIMAQKGAFVLRPNYHGSGGYGQKFAESIKGRYYELEIPDILSGIDKLIEEGKVDPDKLGTMGWSNGGILSIGLTVWTDRFKVAGVGAADVNWISDYGNCAFGVSFDNYYFKGPFWEELDHYIEKSPLFHLKNMIVPTIIFHGTLDTSVPYEQGWEYYRALQQMEKAPVRFLVFPGQPHGLRPLTHQRRKMKEEIDWFETHFFKTKKEKNKALKEGSPLDIALKKKEMAAHKGHFGKIIDDLLIPEMVRSGNLNVGRFEVTRAQWAAYSEGYTFKHGTGNHPITGISMEEAMKYTAWLSKITGDKYRLPTIKEAGALAQKGGSGNTLDYWSGYPLNPDDAKNLLKKAIEMGGSAPLLLSVDHFSPVGKEMIFGLGGNAAEWAVDKEGKGKAVGKNAASPADRRRPNNPPVEYIGFRVAK